MGRADPEQQTAVVGKRTEEQILRQYSFLGAINKVYRVALTGETDQVVAHNCLTMAEKLMASEFGFICQLNQAGHFGGSPRSVLTSGAMPLMPGPAERRRTTCTSLPCSP